MAPGTNRPALSRSSVRLDQELRAVADAILAEFVRPWFSTFSDDQEFYAEVIGCVAYALREVEKRCKKADFVSLLARDVPNLLQQHYADYRRCRSAIGSSLSGHRSVEELFLGLRPHFALAGSVTENREEEYVRQLSDSLLLVLLPLEEYTSECTRYLLREIVGRRVLLSLVDMLSEPDFVNELVVKLFSPDSEALIQNVVETEEDYEMRISADDNRYQLTSLNGRTPRTSAENGSSTRRRMPSLKGASSASSNSSDVRTRPLVAQATNLDGRRHPEATAMMSVLSNAQNFQRSARPSSVTPYSNNGTKLKGSSSSQFARTVGAVGPPSRPKPPPFVFQIDIFTIMWQIVVGQIRWIWATVCVFFLHMVTYVPFLRRAARSAGFDAIVSGSPSVVLPGQRRASLAELLGADHSSLDEPLVALLSEMFALPTQNWWLSTQLEFFVLPLLRVLSGGAIDWLITDFVRQFLSEPSLVYYLRMLRFTLWSPVGREAEERASRSPTRSRILHLSAIRAVSSSLPNQLKIAFFGRSPQAHWNAARDALQPLQHKPLNKLLLYAFMDLLAGKIIPEIVDTEN